MLAQMAKQLNFLNIELVEGDFLQCCKYAVVVLSPLQDTCGFQLG